MNNKAVFAQRLKCLRKELGYEPKEFAELLEIKLQSYYSYEKGRSAPGFDTLINIAEKSNVSLDWLCGLSSIQNSTTEKNEISSVLTQLLNANKKGKQIEVKIYSR